MRTSIRNSELLVFRHSVLIMWEDCRDFILDNWTGLFWGSWGIKGLKRQEKKWKIVMALWDLVPMTSTEVSWIVCRLDFSFSPLGEGVQNVTSKSSCNPTEITTAVVGSICLATLLYGLYHWGGINFWWGCVTCQEWQGNALNLCQDCQVLSLCWLTTNPPPQVEWESGCPVDCDPFPGGLF